MSYDYEVTDDDLKLAMTAFNDPQTYLAAAQKIFEQEAVAVAREITNIALHGASDKVRLDAGKYVIDRVLGKIRERADHGNSAEPWDGIFSTVVREPTAEERQNGAKPK